MWCHHMNNPFKIIMMFSLLMLFSFPSAYSADVKPAVAVMDFESVGSEEHLGVNGLFKVSHFRS